MASDTLIIKKLPSLLTKQDKINFLKECGAVNVNIIGTGISKYNVAFAQFQSADHAKKALNHLHQQDVLGSYLVVEYARSKKISDLANQTELEFKLAKIKEAGTEALLKKFFDKLNYWTAGVDFRAPVPSHLNYHYPPPTPSTLTNISNQMAQSPKFYTQVLHLMNKMNLPCPFVNEQPVFPNLSNTHVLDVISEPVPMLNSESESEISSEDEKIKETIPQLKPKIKKVLKRPRVTKPISLVSKKSKKQKIDEIFEDPRLLIEKKNNVKAAPIDVEKTLPATFESLGFGYIHPQNKLKGSNADVTDIDVRNPMEEERLEKAIIICISQEELKANRISEKDRTILPVFKNYAEGPPTCRLYVKNLAKQTTEEQLKYIYSRFLVQNTDDTPNTFDIRLMQEGRMKGQAFVTLQTVELAKQALNETNGYILNDKPMVVQFARSAVK